MQGIFVISGDLDVVEGPFPTSSAAAKRRNYLNAHLTPAEFHDHGYLAILCSLDEDGCADLTEYSVLTEAAHDD